MLNARFSVLVDGGRICSGRRHSTLDLRPVPTERPLSLALDPRPFPQTPSCDSARRTRWHRSSGTVPILRRAPSVADGRGAKWDCPPLDSCLRSSSRSWASSHFGRRIAARRSANNPVACGPSPAGEWLDVAANHIGNYSQLARSIAAITSFRML
jgi:hypothetical protein